MARVATLGAALLLVVALVTPADVLAQSKDDTIVYALQSDVQNWDPPNSVLRESIILGYNVFDHLAARDLKTGKVGPSLAVSWKAIDDTTWEVKLRQRREVPRRHAVRRQGRQGQLRPGAEPREQAHRARQPRQDQERGGRGRPHRALQDRRALPALRRAAHRARDAVREGHEGEGPRVDAGQPGRHRALQAREVDEEAGARAGAQRRLLGAQARLQERAHPHHPRAGHPDRRAGLRRRGHHQGGAARPDGRDQQVGPGPHGHLADPAHGHDPARPGRALGPQPVPGQARAAGRQPGGRHRLDHQARAQRPRRPHRDDRQSRWPSASTRA